jgi:hypothetical protein
MPNVKEEVLIIFGLNENTTKKNNENGTANRWYIYSTSEIVEKINAAVNSGRFSKIILVESDISVFNFENHKSNMNIKVFGKNFLSSENEITIWDKEDQSMIFNGDNFDFLLPPGTFNLNVAGVDLVGLLSSSIVELSALKYYITFNPSLVKSYKDVTYSRIRGFCKIEK